jgi:hypothetical protein
LRLPLFRRPKVVARYAIITTDIAALDRPNDPNDPMARQFFKRRGGDAADQDPDRLAITRIADFRHCAPLP